MVAPQSQHVALTRVDIRATALAIVRRTGWQRPWVEASAAPRRPVQGFTSFVPAQKEHVYFYFPAP